MTIIGLTFIFPGCCVTYPPNLSHRAIFDIKNLSTALELFKAENYKYPTTSERTPSIVFQFISETFFLI